MLTIHNLAFERHQRLLFNNIQWTLSAGEWLQVCGANGSGKTTLLRILAGLLEPHDGTVSWQNTDIFQQREHYQQQLLYIGHHNGIKPYLTVYENLNLFCALTMNDPHKIKEVVTQIQLGNYMHTIAMQLSAGQLRRLCLAKLLLKNVPLWILDEPTTALDTQGQQLLSTLLQQHLARGGMAVAVTHQSFSLPDKKIDLEHTYD